MTKNNRGSKVHAVPVTVAAEGDPPPSNKSEIEPKQHNLGTMHSGATTSDDLVVEPERTGTEEEAPSDNPIFQKDDSMTKIDADDDADVDDDIRLEENA